MVFQRSVNAAPAPGLEGSFASANPYSSMLAGDSMLTSGAAGVIVGRMGWARNDTGVVSNAHPGVASRLGFVSRYNVVLITTWLGAAAMTIQPGIDMTLHDGGDFWARFTAGATIGQKVYASYADGTLTAAATGSATTATGVTVTTVNGSPNVTAVAGGTLFPGQPVSGAGIPAGTTVVSTSGTTAVLSANATASASGVAITQTTNFETRWNVHSSAAAGEIAKISTRGLN